MARVTVEDCLEYCENRFDLVLKAAARAHRLELGLAEAMVPLDNDKPAVLALREIAEGYDVTRDEAEEQRRREENELVERFLGARSSSAAQDEADAQVADSLGHAPLMGEIVGDITDTSVGADVVPGSAEESSDAAPGEAAEVAPSTQDEAVEIAPSTEDEPATEAEKPPAESSASEDEEDASKQ